MDAYTVFAELYDIFMEEVPYEQWCKFLIERLKEAGIEDGLVVDLGCGTGTLTSMLADQGYDMIGVDYSEDMLERAMEKREQTGQDILYLCQDMCEFELYGTVRAIVCACDSLNYITDEEQLLQVFRLVNNYLDPHGLFFFDVNTIYKFQYLLGDQVFAENSEKGSFIWENHYDTEQQINEYAMTFYLRQEDDTYQRYEEYHYERAYSVEKIKELLAKAGLELVTVYDDYTTRVPKEDSQRLCFVARECTKTFPDHGTIE